MALRGDRNYTDGTDISFFCNEVAEKGEVMVFSTVGSGAAMDDPTAVVTSPSADPSGEQVAGILLNDVVNLDLTRQHINWHKDEVQLGGKVTLLRRGVIVTNMIESGVDPTNGSPAYFMGGGISATDATVKGRVTTTQVSDFGTAAVHSNSDIMAPNYRVGTFLSKKDSDGYAKVQVNLL